MSHVDWERIRRSSLARLSNGLTEQPDRAGDELRGFCAEPDLGITSSPTVRTWLPQRLVASDWQSPIPWLPEGFRPFEFQAKAFARLSVANQLPRPTAIAAPEGSGKSECFLLPILDHCARQQGMNRSGIKAVIIYASRAAASDNAARLGSLCATVERFHSLRPALLIDDFGASGTVGPGYVIDSIDAMTTAPPDVLLTVPEMLERSLNTKRHHRLWAETTPVSLRFIVLDDLHFYTDTGIEDLAVLLRRLGTSLGMASPTQPLGGAVPVVTAGVRIPAREPVDAPQTTDDHAIDWAVAQPDVPPSAPPVGLPSMPKRSVLPKPTIDTRTGASALPDLSTAPAAGPNVVSEQGSTASPSGLPTLSANDSEHDEEGDSDTDPLLELATFLFGVRFKADALIVDSTMTPDELCPTPDHSLPAPSLVELGRIPRNDSASVISALFGAQAPMPTDAVTLGRMLCIHPLIHLLLSASCHGPVTADAIEAARFTHEPSPSSTPLDEQLSVRGLQHLASLLGAARRQSGSSFIPLARVDGQLSIREMGRVVRLVSNEPEFASAERVMLDHPSVLAPPRLDHANPQRTSHRRSYLPAVSCSNCGSSGWLAALLGQERLRASLPSSIRMPLGQQGGNLAIIMAVEQRGTARRGDTGTAGASRSGYVLNPGTLDIRTANDSQTVDGAPISEDSNAADLIEVRLVSGATAVSRRTCPVCDQQGSVDLLGMGADDLMAEASKVMVTASSEDDGASRLIVLTNSADTARRQIESLADDAYVSMLRSRAIQTMTEAGSSLSLSDLISRILSGAASIEQLQDCAPADLRDDPRLVSLWGSSPRPEDVEVLRDRVEFEIVSEFARRSADVGSLVNEGRVVVRTGPGDLAGVVQQLSVTVQERSGRSIQPETIREYLEGLLDRMRIDGAISTPLLRQFVMEGGDTRFVTVSRPVGLPELSGLWRPKFITTAVQSNFTSVTSIHQHTGGPRTWLIDLACDVLGINSVDAPDINWAALNALADEHDSVFAIDSLDGHRVYGLTPDAIQISLNPAAVSGSGAHGSDLSSAVRALSTVGMSAVEKVRTEWRFKYAPPGEAPNVLYMSAGHVRSDRDVVDTTIDLAIVDSLVADASAIDEMGSIPEVRRVGIRSGSGTVVLIDAERDQIPELAQTDSTTDAITDVDTEAALPQLPERLRATEDDYVDFLFDRVTDGSITFPHSFTTLAEMMALAHEVPKGPATPTQQTSPTSSLQVPPGGTTDEPRQIEISGVVVPEMDFKLNSPGLVPDDKPLFTTLVETSAASTSLTKARPVEEYLRTVAPAHSYDEAERLKRFASDGVGPYLELLHLTWSEATRNPATRNPDDLGAMSWRDGVRWLQRQVSQSEADDTDPSATDAQKPGHSDAAASSAWVTEDGSFGIEYHGGGAAPYVRMRLPVLDIQGWARAESFAAALDLSARDVLDLSDGLLASLEFLDATEDRSNPASMKVAELRVTSPSGGRDLARLAEPETLGRVLEVAIAKLANCSCSQSGHVACHRCLLNHKPSQSNRSAVSHPADVSVSRLLAIETLEAVLSTLSRTTTVDVLPTSVPESLKRSELARAFELALRVWVDREPDIQGSFSESAGGAYLLSMTFDGWRSVYEFEPSGNTGPQPGYRIRPLEGEWPVLDVILNPQSTGTDEHDGDENDGGEAARTLVAAVRDSQANNRLGWVLSWTDIREFYDAAVAADAADVADRAIVSDVARRAATQIQTIAGGQIRVESLEQNPFSLMLDIMARPVREEWAAALDAMEAGVKRASGEGTDGEITAPNRLALALLAGLRR